MSEPGVAESGTGPDPAEWDARYRTLPPGVRPPSVLDALAGEDVPELVWRNDAGGQTWRIGERFLKWSPDSAGIDLRAETRRLRWLHGRHPAPMVLDEGPDWFVTASLGADSAVTDQWRADPERAVVAIAEGLRRLHALPVAEVPAGWTSWAALAPAGLGPRPPVDDPVVVHGDACAPNTLVHPDGRFAGHVDLGDLVVGDRWADLAVASMSLEWNYGPGWEPRFLDAYGIDPDPARTAYYRALWHAES